MSNFKVGERVRVEGVPAKGPGEGLLGSKLTVVNTDNKCVETDDGSVWHLKQNGGYNLKLKGHPHDVYQTLLRIVSDC